MEYLRNSQEDCAETEALIAMFREEGLWDSEASDEAWGGRVFLWVKAVGALYMWSMHHLSIVNRGGAGCESCKRAHVRLGKTSQ